MSLKDQLLMQKAKVSKNDDFVKTRWDDGFLKALPLRAGQGVRKLRSEAPKGPQRFTPSDDFREDFPLRILRALFLDPGSGIVI
jgi:hypothetical protein